MPSGRPLGSKNKQSHAEKNGIKDKLAAMGCDPIIGMARIALECELELKTLDEAIEATDDVREKADNIRCKGTHMMQAGGMYKELAQYVAPKRKAIEHSGNIELISVADQLEEMKQAAIDAKS